MSGVTCWRCQGTGQAREARNNYARATCSSCEGSGQPERIRQALLIAEALHTLREVAA